MLPERPFPRPVSEPFHEEWRSARRFDSSTVESSERSRIIFGKIDFPTQEKRMPLPPLAVARWAMLDPDPTWKSPLLTPPPRPL